MTTKRRLIITEGDLDTVKTVALKLRCLVEDGPVVAVEPTKPTIEERIEAMIPQDVHAATHWLIAHTVASSMLAECDTARTLAMALARIRAMHGKVIPVDTETHGGCTLWLALHWIRSGDWIAAHGILCAHLAGILDADEFDEEEI